MRRQPSDPESLMYSFLYVATQGDLPWARMGHTTIRGAPATYAKLACMTQSKLFDDQIATHLKEPSHKAIAKNLRGLFFPNDKYGPVSVPVNSLQHLTCSLEKFRPWRTQLFIRPVS